MPTSLTSRIAARKVSPNQAVAWWLGGSGFIFKFADNHTVCIDPYLSNSVKAIFDLGRAAPSPVEPDELDVDVVVAMHWHEDHLDPGTIPQVAKAHPKTCLITTPSAAGRAMGWGVPRTGVTAFSEGSEWVLGQTRIQHAPARHDAGIPGWESPDAMGVLMRTPGLTIYQSGDTEYDIKLRLLRDQKPDVAILCINGAGGNMDAHEAAMLAWQLKAGIVIPMHHILWDRILGPQVPTLDPQLFADTYRNLGGKGKVVLPVIGEEIVLAVD